MQKLCQKRLQKELALNQPPYSDLILKPVNKSLNKWHFTFHGPRDSVYEDGIYHGLLLLPRTYPYAPPDLLLFTPSGRYQTRTRLCLNVTSFHKEEWSPVWTLEQIVRAFRSKFIGKYFFFWLSKVLNIIPTSTFGV
jgi:ubiquitin-protein ligase